jgi:hypothetical protein
VYWKVYLGSGSGLGNSIWISKWDFLHEESINLEGSYVNVVDDQYVGIVSRDDIATILYHTYLYRFYALF